MIKVLKVDAELAIKLNDIFVLIGRHIKECLTMFGVTILTQIVNMKFIQTNKKSEMLAFLKAMAIIGTYNAVF